MKRTTILSIVIAIAACAIVAAAIIVVRGGGAGGAGAATGSITVVASFNPIYYLVKPVVGSHAEVLDLIAPGVEPHDYEPTPQDALTLSEGKVFFYDGPALENWAVNLSRSVNSNIVLVPLIDSINASQIRNNASIEAQDPHFWLDPALMPSVVRRIEAEMIAIDPANATNYTENADAFIAQLGLLSRAYAAGLAHCRSRTLIDSHAFLGYLAISYNLTELPVGNDSPDQEPSAARVANIITTAINDHVAAIFQESADPTEAIDQNIAQEINGTLYKVYTMEVLTPEQLAGRANYTSLMYQNLQVLEEGLGCTPSNGTQAG